MRGTEGGRVRGSEGEREGRREGGTKGGRVRGREGERVRGREGGTHGKAGGSSIP